jgi:hypothetical protein
MNKNLRGWKENQTKYKKKLLKITQGRFDRQIKGTFS